MNAPRLSLATLPAGALAYDPRAVRVGVVHIGPGAFHRAHQGVYFDALLARDARWGVSAISLRSKATRDALVAQDGLYTLAIEDAEPRICVAGAIREALTGAQYEDFLARFSSPETHLVTMTITEAGYCLGADGALDFEHAHIRADLARPNAPRSALGWLVAGLRARRAAGLAPPVVLSCDNLARNGAALKGALTALARAQDRELGDWIAGELAAPNTMVDAITPATTPALLARAAAELGVEDRVAVGREAFSQWVIERFGGAQPDWASVGVTIAGDIAPFARAKLRLLNGAHSTLAYLGALAGFDTVHEAVRDSSLARFVRMQMDATITTLGSSDGLDLAAYRDAILKRFANPVIRHALSQIAIDGSQKLPIRLLDTLEDLLAKGAPIASHVLPVAAWMRFVRRRAASGGAIADPLAARLRALGLACSDTPQDVHGFVAIEAMFGARLREDARFLRCLEDCYSLLLTAERSTRPLQAVATWMSKAA